jgi:hypothetical protein
MLLPLMVVVLAITHYVRLERQDDHYITCLPVVGGSHHLNYHVTWYNLWSTNRVPVKKAA